jgi:hypothetical protein
LHALFCVRVICLKTELQRGIKLAGDKALADDSSDFCFRMADQTDNKEYLNVQNTHDFSEGESFFAD